MTRADARSFVTELDRSSGVPLHRQLYLALRDAILNGRIRPGARLPSTRMLAAELRVARNTVLAAYQQLHVDGLLAGHVGAGTRVKRGRLGRTGPTVVADPAARSRRVASRCAALAGVVAPLPSVHSDLRAFAPSLPAVDEFPTSVFVKLVSRHARGLAAVRAARQDPRGDPELRTAVADYLGAARGVSCSAEEIFITSGAQQALDLAARLLLDPDDPAGVEDPAYPGAVGAFLAAGARLIPIPVDRAGLSVPALEHRTERLRAVYVSPTHQFPLGVCMPTERRLALLDWARRTDTWLLEDDSDSEFRFGADPLPALAALDADGRVLHAGSFSKTLLPNLRLGYLVTPPDLVPAALAVRVHMDIAPSLLLQRALADFIADGHFARHVQRMRSVYGERRAELTSAGEQVLGDVLELEPDDTGFRVVAWLRRPIDDRRIACEAAARGVEVLPLSIFYVEQRPPRPGLLLSFGATRTEDMAPALRQLRVAIERAERAGGAGPSESAVWFPGAIHTGRPSQD